MMATINWSSDRHRSKRQRKYTNHQVPIDLAEARWQCKTCTDVIASDADVYCVHCKLYWNDLSNGLFEEDEWED